MTQFTTKIQTTQLTALQELERARFLLKRTYPLIQEQKLFLEILHILNYFYQKLEDLCFQLLLQDNILPKTPKNNDSKHRILIDKQQQIQNILGQDFDITLLIDQKTLLQKLLETKKTGPAHFPRKKDYIICENNYKVQVISESFTLRFLANAEVFGKIIAKL